MKALSIKNPWGFCIAKGWKLVENRSRRTTFRGRILIHVSKKDDKVWDWDVFKNKFALSKDQMYDVILDAEARRGCIIGEVDIVDCLANHPSIWAIKGQYHWVLENPVIYEKYIQNIKGKLGLWEYIV